MNTEVTDDGVIEELLTQAFARMRYEFEVRRDWHLAKIDPAIDPYWRNPPRL